MYAHHFHVCVCQMVANHRSYTIYALGERLKILDGARIIEDERLLAIKYALCFRLRCHCHTSMLPSGVSTRRSKS